jgi:ABC-2 type transport system permease protein
LKALRQIARLTLENLRSQHRDGQLVFWNYGFFLLLMVLFLAALGRDPSVRVVLVSGITTIAVMGTALFSVGIGMSGARDRGIYRRLSMFPVPMSRFLWAAVLSRWLVTYASSILLLLVARLVFGVGWPGGAWAWAAGLAAAAAAFCALGFVIAGVASASHRANAFANIVFVPMLVLSGATLPVGFLPDWIRPASSLLPATALVNLLQGTIIRGEGAYAALGSITNLILWTVAAGAAGAVAWRRRGMN